MGLQEPDDRTAQGFFEGSPAGLAIYEAVRSAAESLGPLTVSVTKSQVALRRARGFAYVWRPGQYVASDVPAVLSIALPRRLDSPRFKSVVNPSARTWMHHLELRAPAEIDVEVRAWLAEAYDAAG